MHEQCWMMHIHCKTSEGLKAALLAVLVAYCRCTVVQKDLHVKGVGIVQLTNHVRLMHNASVSIQMMVVEDSMYRYMHVISDFPQARIQEASPVFGFFVLLRENQSLQRHTGSSICSQRAATLKETLFTVDLNGSPDAVAKSMDRNFELNKDIGIEPYGLYFGNCGMATKRVHFRIQFDEAIWDFKDNAMKRFYTQDVSGSLYVVSASFVHGYVRSVHYALIPVMASNISTICQEM